MSNSFSRQDGFTLIEVLIASLILFSVISSTTLVYRAALLSSGKAENSLSLTAAVPSIRLIVSEEFRETSGTGERFGEGTYGDLLYRWSARPAYEGLPKQTTDGIPRNLRFYLWEIHLRVEKGNSVRNYSFSEVTS